MKIQPNRKGRITVQRMKAVAMGFMVMGLVYTVHAQDNPLAARPSAMAAGMLPQKSEDISPLLYGEKIPVAVLPDASGNMFDLNKAVGEKPTVLVFYRGGWCPYCTRQLSGLQDALPELEKLGYQVIAVSTDAPDKLRQSAEKGKLAYTLLSDADLAIARQFGIAYKAPEGYWKILPANTGGKDVDLLLPVPAVFILDKKGVIQFEYINPDFTRRLQPELLKAAAGSLRSGL
jgi:peroxiredoxin